MTTGFPFTQPPGKVRRVQGGMSILVLTPEYPPRSWGGLGVYLEKVVPLLAEGDAEVDVVVCPTYAAAIGDPADETPAVPALGAIDPSASAADQLVSLTRLTTKTYDVAYVQDAAMAELAVTLRRTGRCRSIVAAAHLPSYSGFSYFDRPIDDARQQAAEALLFRHSEKVVAPSRFAGDLLLRVHMLAAEDVIVLPLGAPHSSMRDSTTVRRETERLDVCVVGRIAKQKGLPQLREVVEQTPAAVARFTHIGRETAPADRAMLDRLPLTMHGQVSHRKVVERLTDADVLLSTSLHETFGLAILDAMAVGAVPVGFDCGALPELVTDSVNGRLVPIGDTDALTSALEDLQQSPETLVRMRTAAFDASRSYSWKDHTDALIATFERA
jgi:glycosyltransferase involved in cell wall biosynthesis